MSDPTPTPPVTPPSTTAEPAGSKRLGNLADLLQSQPHPSPTDLATARRHAEAALAIQQTLNPAATQIWKTYPLLAQISDKQGQADSARTYRQQARQAKAAFAGLDAGGDADFLNAKLATGRYYMARQLPATAMHLARIESGADPVMALAAEAF